MSSLNPQGPFPQMFGRYEVRELLGQGGMATVYLAHDTVLDRAVALKIPLARLRASRNARQHFLHEAQAMASLAHDALCPILDRGILGDTPYLTMRFVPGVNREDYRPDQGAWLPPPEAVEVVHALSLALAELLVAYVGQVDAGWSGMNLAPATHRGGAFPANRAARSECWYALATSSAVWPKYGGLSCGDLGMRVFTCHDPSGSKDLRRKRSPR